MYTLSELDFLDETFLASKGNSALSFQPPQPYARVQLVEQEDEAEIVWEYNETTDRNVLILAVTTASAIVADVLLIFDHLRIKSTVHLAHESLRYLYLHDDPQYTAIVVENLDVYSRMSQGDLELLRTYCRRYKVGILSFVSPVELPENSQLPFSIEEVKDPDYYNTVKDSPIFRITKTGQSLPLIPSSTKWAHLRIKDERYRPLAFVSRGEGNDRRIFNVGIHGQDGDLGVDMVFLNNGFQFWVEKLLFLDAIYLVSGKTLNIQLKRYVLMDVDDTLRAETTKTPTVADIKVNLLIYGFWQSPKYILINNYLSLS